MSFWSLATSPVLVLKPIWTGSFEYFSMTWVNLGGNAMWLFEPACICEMATGWPAITTSSPIVPPPLCQAEPEKNSSAGPLISD